MLSSCHGLRFPPLLLFVNISLCQRTHGKRLLTCTTIISHKFTIDLVLLPLSTVRHRRREVRTWNTQQTVQKWRRTFNATQIRSILSFPVHVQNVTVPPPERTNERPGKLFIGDNSDNDGGQTPTTVIIMGPSLPLRLDLSLLVPREPIHRWYRGVVDTTFNTQAQSAGKFTSPVAGR